MRVKNRRGPGRAASAVSSTGISSTGCDQAPPDNVIQYKARTTFSTAFANHRKDLESIEKTAVTELSQLVDKQSKLAARRPGQKEVRYCQLLGGAPDLAELEALAARSAASSSGGAELAARVETLEAAVEALQEEVAELCARLGGAAE